MTETCKACERRRRVGLEGQCPACANERTARELDEQRAKREDCPYGNMVDVDLDRARLRELEARTVADFLRLRDLQSERDRLRDEVNQLAAERDTARAEVDRLRCGIRSAMDDESTDDPLSALGILREALDAVLEAKP